jgi:hypothetical protein
MREFFLEGGWWMYPIAFFGVGGVAAGATALASRSKGTAFAGLALATIVMLLGVAGMMSGRTMTDDAVAHVSPDMAEAIRAQGHKEANRPLQLAGPLALLGLVLSGAAFAMAERSS